jgi:D,D-heptose 1,7-bisphosphate phosphatase
VKQIAILIGGKGSRLRDAVHDTPKPLLEVCGRPFVEHVMINLRRFGFTEFLLLADYHSSVVQDHYSDNDRFANELGANIRVIVEPSPLGTGGALLNAKEHLADEFLVLNGDSIFDFNYLDLCNCPRNGESDNWLGRVALLPVEDATRYGLVDCDGAPIIALGEKPTEPQSGTINSGVYWLRREALDVITQTPCSLEQEVFPQLISQGRLVARTYTGYFIDIGIPEDLETARTGLANALRKPAAFLDRDGTLNHDTGYTHKIEGFCWIENAKQTIRMLNDNGYLVFLVTNQAGIARGFYGPDDVDTLHSWMKEELANIGAHIDDIRYCPHHPEGTVKGLTVECDCRKPGTAMLDSLIDQWQPLLEDSFMIGDEEKDAEAGAATGIHGRKINPGNLQKEVLALMHQAKGQSSATES